MDRDDLPVGRVLSRREVLTLMGMSGAALLIGCRPSRETVARTANGSLEIPACVVVPEQTEGPYFTDVRLDRSDIRSDPATGVVKAGAPFALTFMLSRVGNGGCTPLAGALVDLWHCDADGIYSDVRDPSFDTTGQKFLRGHQVTDSSGRASFRTIFPGWYRGRTVHLHFKVRTEPEAARGHEFTSQLYFDDALTDRVFRHAPYAKPGNRTRNAEDGIFRRGGDQLLLTVADADGGYAATFEMGMQTS